MRDDHMGTNSDKDGTELSDVSSLSVVRREDQTDAEALAEVVLEPTVQSGLTLSEQASKAFGEVSTDQLVASLRSITDAARGGDLGPGEEMLAAQAHVLDALFNDLTRRALRSGHLPSMEASLRVALRAQAQCRATWEALSAIKNPPVVGYARQANIAHGPQQVNNGPRTGESEIPPNELLERNDGERLDTGAASPTGRADPELETLGEIDRAEN